jgi:tRNA-modifying protein YgfZ
MNHSPPSPLPLAHWRAFTMSGSAVSAFLNRLLTVKAPDLGSGAAAYGALLNPQGKIQHELFLHARADGTFRMEVLDQFADVFVRRLTLLRLRDDVTIVPDLARPVLSGDRLADGFADPRLEGVFRNPVLTEAVTPDHYDNWRISLGLPEQGRDYGFEDRWPTDVNMDRLGGVNLQKGCFVGQEVVSRMIRKGGIKRRSLRVSATQALSAGPVMSEDDMPLGEITSVSGKEGLAILRLDRLELARSVHSSTGLALTLHTEPVSAL